MKQLKLRQICLIFIAFVPTTKVLLMPASIAFASKNDLWISTLINVLLDMAVIAAVLYVCKKNDNVTFFEILKLNFGNVAAKIIIFIYALYFLMKMYVPLMEQKLFLEKTLYESAPRSFFFLPFFVISFYSCLKGIRSIGRCADIMFWFTVPAIVMILLLAFPNSDFSALLPIGFNNTKNILKGISSSMLWFGQGIYMLFFMGKFKYEKRSFLKVLLSYFITGLVVVFFMMVFYATFSSIADRQHFALLKISRYSLVLSSIGRFDFLAIFLLITSTIYALTIPILYSVECLSDTFNFKKKIVPALIINGLLILSLLFTDKYFSLIMNFIQKYLLIPFVLFAYVFPICVMFLKKGEKTKDEKA